MFAEREAQGSEQAERQRAARYLLWQHAEVSLELEREIDERAPFRGHADQQVSAAVSHFFKRFRRTLTGFLNLSLWQIFGFGRRLPGDRFPVGAPSRHVQVNILFDILPRSPMYLFGRLLLRFAGEWIGPSALGRLAWKRHDVAVHVAHDRTAALSRLYCSLQSRRTSRANDFKNSISSSKISALHLILPI